ncbi:MAG: cupin domain-containing protein [Cyanobacteria bacterium]|nr:cupin domain-containing protein [Cyanobacteriota bacterium]MDW8202773.1 cupin domain-containing protein [Cyanobacteriota bacterium SKYGB_h_bin112]
MAAHYCFCELAPLYALGTLSAEQKLWVEQQIADCPELAEELAIVQETVAALAYSTPLATLSPALKQRLLQQLTTSTPAPDVTSAQPEAELPAPLPTDLNALDELATLTQRTTNSLELLTNLLAGLKWRPHAAPGIEIVLLSINYRTQRVVCLLKAEAGARYPLHDHRDVEEIFMLAGDLVDGDRTYHTGDYIRSGIGSSHAPFTREGCIFLVRSSLKDKILKVAARPSLLSWFRRFWRQPSHSR